MSASGTRRLTIKRGNVQTKKKKQSDESNEYRSFQQKTMNNNLATDATENNHKLPKPIEIK